MTIFLPSTSLRSAIAMDAKEIYGFCQSIRNRSPNSRLFLNNDITIPYPSPHAPAISVSRSSNFESDTRQRRRHQKERSHASTSSSGATKHSTLFDRSSDTCSVSSSACTDIPRNGPEPLHRQRPPLPLPSPWSVPAPLMPCEFHWYDDCQVQLGLHDVDDLVDHILMVHLNETPPPYSICWFCDQGKFKSVTESPEEREAAYRRRMAHIASHFRNGLTVAEIRPDFFFLEHLHNNGLIADAKFQEAKGWSELDRYLASMNRTLPPTAGGGMPMQIEIEVANRSRRGGASRSHRGQNHEL